jgi:DNA processing protein
MDCLDTHQAYFILNGLPGFGAATGHRLVRHFAGNPAQVLQASREALHEVPNLRANALESLLQPAAHFAWEKEAAQLQAIGGRFVAFDHSDYPELLKTVYDPPLGLYCLGPVVPGPKCIAIVGSRRSTLYGQEMAKRFAAQLSQLGFCIVSGMARGIDAAAHQGALNAGGHTVAVFGSGVDVVYPPEHQKLYEAIARQGGILSELRLGARCDRYTFPLRNRIIAGLCQAVLVIETDEHGGSMITAHTASEQGRMVFAVPGRIDQNTSQGCHKLIREGATLVRHTDDILEELSYLDKMPIAPGPIPRRPAKPSYEGLSEKETLLLKALHQQGLPTAADSLAEATELPIAQVNATLLSLELKKLLVKRADGRFEAKG